MPDFPHTADVDHGSVDGDSAHIVTSTAMLVAVLSFLPLVLPIVALIGLRFALADVPSFLFLAAVAIWIAAAGLIIVRQTAYSREHRIGVRVEPGALVVYTRDGEQRLPRNTRFGTQRGALVTHLSVPGMLGKAARVRGVAHLAAAGPNRVMVPGPNALPVWAPTDATWDGTADGFAAILQHAETLRPAGH